jgi:hypothetical protein
MHDYLRAIGFSQIHKKEEMKLLVEKVLLRPDEKLSLTENEDNTIIQLNKDFGDCFGISVVAEIDQMGRMDIEYYYPYVKGKNMFYQEEINVEKYSDREAYAGICENINIGVPLIFYIHNFVHYLNMKKYKDMFPKVNNAVLSGLSISGTVILNIEKDEQQIKNEKSSTNNRNQLLQAAREGDMEAIEILTLDDMDMYTMVSKRAKREDIFTIVDTYCIPYGIETDKYSIMGTIEEVEEQINRETDERLYYLSITCNDLEFDICINEKDLFGEPAPGRRFKGVVWLQGLVDYI